MGCRLKTTVLFFICLSTLYHNISVLLPASKQWKETNTTTEKKTKMYSPSLSNGEENDTSHGYHESTVVNTSAVNFSECFQGTASPEIPCRIFYPLDFYDTVGRSHRKAALREGYDNKDRLLPANYLRFVRKKKFQSSSLVWPPDDITYVHVRKAGGITMKFFGLRLAKQKKRGAYRMDNYFTVSMRERWKKDGYNVTLAAMKKMAQQTRFFTFVRHPISRFRSAMGQFLSAPKANHMLRCHCHDEDSNNCTLVDLKEASPDEAMECVLDTLREGRNRVNEHLVPASIEMHQMMWGHKNASVVVMPMTLLNDFMKSFQVQPFTMNHAKGRIKRRYAKANLTLAMIETLCQVYAVDILMLRSLGLMEIPECP